MKKMFSQGLALVVVFGLTNCAYAMPNTYNLDEMIVTASKTNLNLKELPQSIEIITQEDIKAVGATNVYEAMRAATNINAFEPSAANHRVQVRGSNKILILVNGHRIANDKSASDRVMERFNAGNIERIEILRGPAATIYGSDAMAGVINIITKKSAEKGVTVGVNSSRRQTNNYYEFNTGKDGKASASLSANITKHRHLDWGDDAGTTSLEGLRQDFRFDLDYDMDEANKLLFALEYNKSDLDYYSKDSMFGPGHWDNMKKEIRTANLGYEGNFDKNKFVANISMNEVERENDQVYRLVDFDARNSVRMNDQLTLTYGGEFRMDKAPVGSGREKSSDQWAAFVQGEYRVSDKLLLIPAIRYDDHESFGDHTSPSIGMTYFISDDMRLKAIYGTAYKAPTIKELYGGKYANPNLKPEKSKGYELAYEQEFSEVTSMKIAYFKNKEEDGIKMRFVPPYGYYNLDSAEYEGVEFAVKHDLGNGFTAGFNYEYLDARDVSRGKNTRLKHTAPNTFTVRLQWLEPENQEWSVTTWNKWLSDYKDNNGDARSINTLDLVVNKKWNDGKYNAYVGVDNLLDHDSSELRYYGRMYRFGVEANF